VVAHLPCEWQCEALDLNVVDPFVYAKEHLENLEGPFFLMGYSMGGRIAWRLAPYLYRSLQGLIILGAHPGLATKEEKNERWESDKQWIDLLEKGDMEVFLRAWLAQPIFASMRNKEDVIAKRMKRDPQTLASIMRRTSLALQPRLENFSPSLFLHGEEDLKYANIYSEMPCVESIVKAGHAAHLDNPRAVADAIRRFVETKT